MPSVPRSFFITQVSTDWTGRDELREDQLAGPCAQPVRRMTTTRRAKTSAVIGLFAMLAVSPAIAAPQTATSASLSQEVVRWDGVSKAALLAAFDDRARHGLDRITFLDAPDTATDDAYTDAALRYAQALAHGMTDPAALHDPFTLKRSQPQQRAALAAALSGNRLGEWLAGLAPSDPDYASLSQAYRDLRARPDPTAPDIPAGVLKVGSTDPRVPAIRERLATMGYMLVPPVAAVPVYTRQIAGTIEEVQRDNGIAADGIIGPDTLAVLNRRPSDRAGALAVALERRRWLERTPPATRIDVNTAAAELRYYRDGVLVDTRRVVVGKRGTETPPLQSPVYRLVANPTWTVPKSIQNGELAGVGADYLAANNMTLRDGWIVQGSGPDNALGMVKFDMANTHAIYLHDTSAPELFDASQRHRSHGCVRVEDALGFAQMLAEDQGLGDEWATAQMAGEQQFVPLKTRIPVRLLYHNAFVDGAGTVAVRTDPYGWNAPIARALGFADSDTPDTSPKPVDIAP